MIRVRTLIGVVMAMMLAAFSPLTLAAPQPAKVFTIKMSVGGQLGGTLTDGASVVAKFTNELPPTANSTINSIELFFPSGVTVSGGASGVTTTPPSDPKNIAVVTDPTTGVYKIRVSNLNPVTPQQFVLVNFTASITAPTCEGYDWSGTAWTGSGFNGQPFQLQPAPPSVLNTGANTAACELRFKTQPPNGLKNTALTPAVQVALYTTGTNNIATFFTGAVTLAQASGPTATFGGLGPVNAVSGVATFSNVTVDTIGSYTVTATNATYGSVTSNLFTIFDGTLNCNPTPPFHFSNLPAGVTNSTQSGYAAGDRGYWNKDGMNCVPIPYIFTNTILTDNTVHLAWDTSQNPPQHPSFTYTMTWKAEDVDNPNNPDSLGSSNYGWPVPRRPQVAWQTDNGLPTGNPIFHDGLVCAGTDLPAPYAMLNAAVTDTTTTTISVVLPVIAPTNYPKSTFPANVSPTNPFPIVIDLERMSVTGIDSSAAPVYTLTVVRGDGGTQATTHAKFNASNVTVYNTTGQTYVMSTPLPIDPNTLVQVPMCIVNHGWMTAGTVNGIPQVKWFTTVYDIGDGWVLNK